MKLPPSIIEFPGLRGRLHLSALNHGEIATIKGQAGLNSARDGKEDGR
jgi:hypothetical protein